jgi:hypothetical protein
VGGRHRGTLDGMAARPSCARRRAVAVAVLLAVIAIPILVARGNGDTGRAATADAVLRLKAQLPAP